MKQIFTSFIFFTLTFGIPTGAVAQSTDNVRVKVANLYQDVSLLTEKVGQLTLEIDRLRQENRKLFADLEDTRSGQNKLVTSVNGFFDQMDQRFEELDQIIVRENSKIKAETILEMKKQIEALATRTQKSINAIATMRNSRNTTTQSAPTRSYSQPSAPTTTTFTNDYPQNGVAYRVTKGDTISRIAAKFNTKTKYIINANRLTNPNALKIGQTLFIPQAE